MTLVQYFEGLAPHAKIDADIIATIDARRFINNTPRIDGLVDLVHYASRNSTYDFLFVSWAERLISTGDLISNECLLSAQFSGCHLAKFTTSDGRRYGAHIHCGAEDFGDQRANWNGYMNSEAARSVVIFRPNTRLTEAYRAANPRIEYDLWGIIDQNDRCYSLVVERNQAEGIWLFEQMEPTEPVADFQIPARAARPRPAAPPPPPDDDPGCGCGGCIIL